MSLSAGWWVLLSVTGLLALLLCGRISLRVDWAAASRVRVRYWGITVYRVPGKAAPEEPEPEKTGKKAKKKEKDKKSFLAEAAEGGLGTLLTLLERLARVTASAARRLLRGVRVDRLTLGVTVAGEDAAETAVRYGQVCAAVYPGVTALCGVMRVGRRQVAVEPDYLAEASSVRLRLRAHVTLGRALWAALRWLCGVVWVTLKSKEKKAAREG